MSSSLLLAFVLFIVVALFTPGPNNIMLLSSGLTHGFRRTLPHVAGITIGFAVMVALMGIGFGALFVAYPMVQVVLKYAGAAYLAYLAVTIALSGPTTDGDKPASRPMTFIAAALFQWVNVKGWVIALGTITAYAKIAAVPWNIVLQTALVLLVGSMSSITWAMFGSALRPVLTSPGKVRMFNVTMAVLLLASLYLALMET